MRKKVSFSSSKTKQTPSSLVTSSQNISNSNPYSSKLSFIGPFMFSGITAWSLFVPYLSTKSSIMLLSVFAQNRYSSMFCGLNRQPSIRLCFHLQTHFFIQCNVILNEKIIWYHNKSYIILFLYVHIIPTIMIVM